MKYTIRMSCGHEDTVDLFGKGTDRDRRIKYFEASGLCKECYKKKMNENALNTPLSFNATVLPYINEDNGNILLNVWFDGNTKSYKDEIKSLGGYKWSERSSADDAFSFKKLPMCWNKIIEADCLNDEIKKAKSIGAEYITNEKGLFAMAHYQIALDKQNRWKEKHFRIAEIKKPSVPDILKNRKWNEKIYGKEGNYSIYPDGEKTTISDEEAKIIEEYLKQKEGYKRKVKEIENA